MCLKISKNRTCFRTVHFLLMFSLCFAHGLQNCTASDERQRLLDEERPPQYGQPAGARLAVPADIEPIPEVPAQLLQVPSADAAQESFNQIVGVLNLFNDSQLLEKAKAQEERKQARGRGAGFEAYQQRLFAAAWQGQEAVKTYLFGLSFQVQGLIPLVQQLREFALAQQRMIVALQSENKRLMDRIEEMKPTTHEEEATKKRWWPCTIL